MPTRVTSGGDGNERGGNAMSLFTQEELDEMARADAETDQQPLTVDEIRESRRRDRAATSVEADDQTRRDRAYQRAYRAANKEELAAKGRAYRAANKERLAAAGSEREA